MWKAKFCRFSVVQGAICAWLLIILPLVSSCGSTAETVTGPSQVRCGVQAQAEKLSFASDGGTGTMRVTTNRECTWSAQSEASWLTLTPPMNGQGEGTVQFTVTPNGLPASRATAIKVEDQRLQISQEGRPCEFRVSSTLETVEAAGGDRTVQVTTTSAQCRWTASSDAPWITITSGREGDDTGAVTFRVDPLTGPARTGTLTIAGHVVHVQQGAGCSYTVNTDALNVGAAGGPGEVTVSAPPGCSWTAQSGVPWITVAGGAAGSGPGIVALQVAATEGPARTGTVTVAGRVVTVTQSPGCSVTLDSLTYAAPAAASTSVTTVRAAPGCGWTAATTSDWIVVTSGQTGTGTGEVRFSVAGNTGPSRVGGIRIAGLTLTVNQASGCSVSVNPTSVSVGAAASASAIQVTGAQGCTWSATSGASWIVLGDTASGSGNGQVPFSVAANAGPARQGTLSVGGLTITVNQASGCSVSVSPTSVSVGAAASASAILVTAPQGCTWSATSGASWIVLGDTSSGSGNGQVPFSVAANSGPARQGTLAVGGLTITVAQATGCTYTVTPPSQDVAPTGGTGTASIATGAGCPWTASSSAAWITVGATSGTGPAQVPLTVAPSNEPPRTGTVTIASTVLTVNQASPCEWVFLPPEHTFGPTGGNGNILVIVTGVCTWAATSNVDWITVTSGASGAGNGLVQFVVAGNDGPARTGSLTIGGRRYQVSQAGR
jgi:hypothetical protein